MMMVDQAVAAFEIIDLDSGNVVGDFGRLDDALEAIQRVARDYGWESVEDLSLIRVRGDEQIVLGMNEALVEMARSLPAVTSELLSPQHDGCSISSRWKSSSSAATVIWAGDKGNASIDLHFVVGDYDNGSFAITTLGADEISTRTQTLRLDPNQALRS